MRLKLIILIFFILSTSIVKSQYFTQTQIITINSSNQAFEGDIYIDSVNKNYYIGHADGRLSQINSSVDSVKVLSNSGLIFYWNFKEKDTIDISALRDSNEWKYDGDKGVALRRAKLPNTATDDSVVFATHGRLIIADSINQSLVYSNPNTSTQIFLGNYNPNRNMPRQISIQNENTAGNRAYSLYTSATDSSRMFMGSHGSSRSLIRMGFPVAKNNEIVAIDGGLNVGTFTNEPIRFGTNNINRAIIDSAGNMGIGTSNPQTMFEVAGKSQDQNVRSTVSSATSVTTTSTSYVDVPGMTITVTTADAHLLILAGIPGVLNSNNDFSVNFRITVDGVQVGSMDESEQNNSGGILWTANLHALTPVTAGTHTIRLQWSVQGGTGSINSTQSTQFGTRSLSVMEL